MFIKCKIISFKLFIIISILLCGCPGPPEYDFKVLTLYGEYGSEPGQFNTPMGVITRRVSDSISSSLFIADYGNNRVQIITPATYLHSPDTITIIKEEISDTTILLWPKSVTVTQSIMNDFNSPISDNPCIYVADSKNNRIMVYNIDGVFQFQWGSLGNDPGQFNSPTDIDIDFEGNIYVADSGNHRIQVFDTLGNFIRMWGGMGSDTGQFISPMSLVVCYNGFDSGNFRYIGVSDYGNDRLQAF
ncbi:MAG: 6-bladed beta-propeller, partial [Candidatus Zixiibacteriota bacterium]